MSLPGRLVADAEEYPDVMLLEGIRVLDLTRLLPGAYCSLLLADIGAEILKVEEPVKGDYFRWVEPMKGNQSIYFQCLNRNKRSMTLNLKTPKGKAILLSLGQRHDVLLESFRPGVTGRLGIDYEAVRKVNPGIVYCSISGYGQDGPYRERAVHDGNCLAISGLLQHSGEGGRPPVFPAIPLADMAVGGCMAAFALTSALLKKQRTGEGQYVDISMLDGVLSYLTLHAADYHHTLKETERGDSHFAGGTVANSVYETRDGRFLALSIIEEKFWNNFCRTIGRSDLENRDFLAVKSTSTLAAEVQETLLTRTKDEWVSTFEGKDVCCEPVNTMAEALSNEQVRFRKMVIEIDHPDLGKLKQIGSPIKAPNATRMKHTPSPEMGEHTRCVLREEGFSDGEIDQLHAEEVI